MSTKAKFGVGRGNRQFLQCPIKLSSRNNNSLQSLVLLDAFADGTFIVDAIS